MASTSDKQEEGGVAKCGFERNKNKKYSFVEKKRLGDFVASKKGKWLST